MVSAGQWWRLVTTLFVQDAGLVGAAFNLVALVVVGTVAERFWGTKRWILLAVVSALLAELAGLWWQPIGAGNSVANFGLASSLLTVASRRRTLIAVSAGGLVAGLVLLALRDIHGAAVAAGALLALFLRHCPAHSGRSRPNSFGRPG